MPSPDALRTSLDTHQVDKKAGRDREYVESVLRRIQAPEPGKAEPKSSYGEDVVSEPTDDTPSFARVKAIKHPKKEEPKPVEGVVFKEISTKKAKKRQTLEPEEAVMWEDVTEGEDPDRRPDAKAGYMKGNYALLRRQIDDDHAVYFFATEVPDDAEQTRVPQGYEVRLTEETNLPYIARRGSKTHLNQTAQVRAKDMDEAIDIAAREGLGGIRGE